MMVEENINYLPGSGWPICYHKTAVCCALFIFCLFWAPSSPCSGVSDLHLIKFTCHPQ